MSRNRRERQKAKDWVKKNAAHIGVEDPVVISGKVIRVGGDPVKMLLIALGVLAVLAIAGG